MNYESQKITRTFKSNVINGTNKYRLSYTVSNAVNEPVDNITATIVKVSEDDNGEKTTRVGGGNMSVADGRSYISFEKTADMTSEDYAGISAQFYHDVESVLSE